MAKPRIQVNAGIPAPSVRPVAQARDTFVAQSGAGSQGAQLAQALSSLAPALAQLSGAVFERQAKANQLKGEEAARETLRELDESRKTFADAVRDGQIPAHMNPWMKHGYYEELGRTYASRLQADLTQAIQLDGELANSIEMSDFRTFTSKFEQAWLENNVPGAVKTAAFQIGYGNRRDAILANLEAGWAAQTDARFRKRSLVMFRDEAVQFMLDALDQERSAADIGSFLRQMWDDKHALGWDGTLTGQALVEAVGAVALSKKDAALMEEILSAIPGGDGKSPKASLARTSYAIEAMDKTSETIFSAKRREWSRQDREREEEARALATEASARFEEAEKQGTDPDDVPIDDLQARAISAGNPALVEQLQVMKNAYGNREYQDDNNLVADFQMRLFRSPTGLTQAALNNALRNKRLTLATHSRLSNELEQAKRSGTKKAFLEDDPFHEYGEKTLVGYFSINPDEPDTPLMRYRRQQAVTQYSEWYYRTFVAPDAPSAAVGGMERRRMINEAARDFALSWVGFDDGLASTYRMRGADFDWRSRPVENKDRLKPLLDELSGFLGGRVQGEPSPALMSILTIYGVDLANKQELREFLATQRAFISR